MYCCYACTVKNKIFVPFVICAPVLCPVCYAALCTGSLYCSLRTVKITCLYCTVCFITLCTSSLYQLLYAVMQQLSAHVVMYRYVPALCSVRCILYQICVLFVMSRCAPVLCVLLSIGYRYLPLCISSLYCLLCTVMQKLSVLFVMYWLCTSCLYCM
jgi:hypothetical protein